MQIPKWPLTQFYKPYCSGNTFTNSPLGNLGVKDWNEKKDYNCQEILPLFYEC